MQAENGHEANGFGSMEKLRLTIREEENNKCWLLQGTSTKYFTAAQTGKLIGLRIEDLAKLRKEESGPEYLGVEPYVVYRDYKVKTWAIAHVRAPTIWFERFDSPPEDVAAR